MADVKKIKISGTSYDIATSWGKVQGTLSDQTDLSQALAQKAATSDIKDSTITFTQGGVTKGTFTLNQNSDGTVLLDAGGDPITYESSKEMMVFDKGGAPIPSVTGIKVEDVVGTPIKGAKIWVVSPMYSTTSDKHGKFGLTNVLPTDTIHVKYQKRVFEIPVDTLKSIRVRIADELLVSEEEELVNTGFGFVKRRESCSATSGIPGEVLVRTGRINIIEAMQGLVPGLSVMNGKVSIRSVGTIYGDPTPLFLVDNVEVSSLDYVNIYDVDRVDVLKDANMYGAKGANGAILVTTKRGIQRARR